MILSNQVSHKHLWLFFTWNSRKRSLCFLLGLDSFRSPFSSNLLGVQLNVVRQLALHVTFFIREGMGVAMVVTMRSLADLWSRAGGVTSSGMTRG
jgi:hypothetical protein